MHRPALLALLAALVGAASWWWGHLGWPGRGLVRGHVGDGAATLFLYALLWRTGRGPAAARAAIVAAIALLVEVAQAIHHGGGGAAGELVVGATADGWDLVAYAAGIGFGWAVEAISRAADDGARRRRR